MDQLIADRKRSFFFKVYVLKFLILFIMSVDSRENQCEKRSLPQCTICNKDFELNDVVVSTPCDHILHKTCIINVLKETLGCPVCRKACRHFMRLF